MILWGLPALARTEDTGASFSFPLKYQSTSSYLSSNFGIGKQEVKFRKEPDFGKDKVLRLALKTGSGKNDYVGFAVNITRKSLYLDLNQNLDLTDDPSGVYRAEARSPFPMFRNVQLKLDKNGTWRAYSLDFYFGGRDSGWVTVRSSYQGEIELYGQRWRLEVQDNLDGEIAPPDRVSITPAAGDGGESRTLTGYEPIPAAPKLFLGGHLYRIGYAFGTEAEGRLMTASFTEINSDLGELILEGQHVRRLVLEGGALVVLDQPPRSMLLPVDKYRIQAVYLQLAPREPTLFGSAGGISQLSVRTGAPCRLKLGGPLESTVIAGAAGDMLQLSYFLKGSGGEQYSLNNANRGRPPRFAIYKGDRQLVAGNFQFG